MQHPRLDLPTFEYRLKQEGGRNLIFDVFRKKFVVLTPEEWVRQHLLQHLWRDLGYPLAQISVEKQLQVGKMQKRYDAVVYSDAFEPMLLIECKAPHVAIDQAVFDQAARYNLTLEVPFVLVSNGFMHLMAKVDHRAGQYIFANGLMAYDGLLAERKD